MNVLLIVFLVYLCKLLTLSVDHQEGLRQHAAVWSVTVALLCGIGIAVWHWQHLVLATHAAVSNMALAHLQYGI